jgi:uncharacterized protein YjbI with pentapeptide repeats
MSNVAQNPFVAAPPIALVTTPPGAPVATVARPVVDPTAPIVNSGVTWGGDTPGSAGDFSNLPYSNFAYANYPNCVWREPGPREPPPTQGYNEVGTNLYHTTFFRSDLHGGDFRGIDGFQVDFAGCNLRGCNFTNTDLSAADFTDADCTGSDFSSPGIISSNPTDLYAGLYTDLFQADFSGATLVNCNFTRVDLASACLIGADLTGAILAGADLGNCIYDSTTVWPAGFDPSTISQVSRQTAYANYSGQTLNGTNLNGLLFLPHANFRGATLHNVSFPQSLAWADFTGATLTWDAGFTGTVPSVFNHAIFVGATVDFWTGQMGFGAANGSAFAHADFTNATFIWTDAPNHPGTPAQFIGCNLSYASFNGIKRGPGVQLQITTSCAPYAQFVNADLNDALLAGSVGRSGGQGSNFAYADFTGVKGGWFTQCLLCYATFRGADLSMSDFTNANVANADFTQATLPQAALDGSRNTAASFGDLPIAGVRYGKGTIFPSNIDATVLQLASTTWDTVSPYHYLGGDEFSDFSGETFDLDALASVVLAGATEGLNGYYADIGSAIFQVGATGTSGLVLSAYASNMWPAKVSGLTFRHLNGSSSNWGGPAYPSTGVVLTGTAEIFGTKSAISGSAFIENAGVEDSTIGGAARVLSGGFVANAIVEDTAVFAGETLQYAHLYEEAVMVGESVGFGPSVLPVTLNIHGHLVMQGTDVFTGAGDHQ